MLYTSSIESSWFMTSLSNEVCDNSQDSYKAFNPVIGLSPFFIGQRELNKSSCHSCARTSGSVLYGLPLHQKGNVNKATW